MSSRRSGRIEGDGQPGHSGRGRWNWGDNPNRRGSRENQAGSSGGNDIKSPMRRKIGRIGDSQTVGRVSGCKEKMFIQTVKRIFMNFRAEFSKYL